MPACRLASGAEPVVTDLGGDAFRQDWRTICSGWARLPPFRIVENEKESLVCARHADVREVLLDPDRFSIVNVDPEMRRLAPYKGLKALTSCDGAEHARQRRIMMPPFFGSAVAQLGDRADAIIGALIDGIAARGPGASFDARHDFAAPFMEQLLLDEMFRFGYEQRKAFSAMNESRAALARLRPGEEPPSTFLDAFEHARNILLDIVDARRARPGDDFLSELLLAEDEKRRLTDDEVLGSLFGIASVTTGSTPSAIALALYTLCRHPDQLATLRFERGLLPVAVEECLRYHPPLYLTFPRFATDDTDIGGTAIPRGMAAQLVLAATGFDPARYPEPQRFDIRRDPKNVFLFGTGPHVCIAAKLARSLMARAIGAVIDRFPGLALAHADFRPRYTGTVGELVPETLPLRI